LISFAESSAIPHSGKQCTKKRFAEGSTSANRAFSHRPSVVSKNKELNAEG
jgi:hypothetical protein